VLVELAGHYVNFKESQVFATGNGGFIFRF
jgi:hypothetical protein